MAKVNAGDAYAQSFGALPNETKYAGGHAGALSPESIEAKDMRGKLHETLQVGLKANSTTSGGAGTAGFALVPVYVDPEIVDQSRKFTPLVEMFPRVTNMGMEADFNVITGKGGAVALAEDAALTETDTTYNRESTRIKFLYAVGRVTGPAQAAQPSYMLAGFQPSGSGAGAGVGFSDTGAPNAIQREVLVKAREIKELEENLIINGDSGTTPAEFDGFITILGSTNAVDKGGTVAIALDDITTAVQNAYDDGGRPNIAVCASSVYSDIKNLLEAKIGFLSSTQNVFWGFSTIVLQTMVGPMPLVPSMFMTNTSGSKAIYMLDLSVWEVRVLQDMTFERLAKDNDSEKFFLKQYECLICRAPAFNASIINIL